jgi:outer membrane lipoprotein-sorting protein
MKTGYRLASLTVLLLPLLLSGCFILSTTRRLPVPKAPAIVQTVTPEDLVAQLNKRWAALNSLTASVEIQASQLKTNEGVAKDYTTFRGQIMMRKPEMLRVYGRLPVIGSEMFDMVSDGKNFTMYIPHYNKVYKGTNTVRKKSASLVENMRPGFFLDAMVVRGLEPDDLYSVTSVTVTVEDAAKKHLYLVPEYILSVGRRKGGSQQLVTLREITFHRDDLLPYQEVVYDGDGNVETQVLYAGYRDFDSNKFPSTITILRPLEESQIVLTVEKITENETLPDDQFVINNIPPGTPVQDIE